MKRILTVLAAMITVTCLSAQVTTSGINGIIRDATGKGVEGVTIQAIHTPSGTSYTTTSTKSGRYSIPGMRIGGPYKVTVTNIGSKKEEFNDINLQLGEPSILDVTLTDESKNLQEVVVTANGSRLRPLIAKDKKGVSTNINRRLLATLPTLSRSITDFTKINPQSNGTSFSGQDNRMINLTIDGSIFNNSFGLQPLPGSQTNSTPISLDALEEIQINLSPYNLKDAGFTGASINAVTRSGTNTFHGGAFYNQRTQGLVGTKAGTGGKTKIIVNNFKVQQFGASLGGPIIKNKLFFYLNFEAEQRTDPADIFKADNGSNTGQANVTRVKQSDLDDLSTFLKTKLNYDPGVYDGYSFITKSYKALAKIDWNIDNKNKLSIRYNSLKATRDVPASTSGALGGYGRRDGLNTMNYANNNYVQHNDIYSIIAQLNSRFNNRLSNEITFGWTGNRDYRAVKGKLFPLVDILDGTNSDKNYISFGAEPFTPNNVLNTDTWQASDNLTFSAGKHNLSAGINFESFHFFNQFTPQIQGQYIFNSLADFYTSANAYLADPQLAANPVKLRRYILSYSNLQGGGLWSAVTKARNAGAYIQDDVAVDDKLSITYGVRFDVPFYGSSGFVNTEVDGLSFVDDKGNPTTLSTSKLPTPKLMISPRFGYNYDLSGDKRTQLRGGFGLFAGRPPFVFISNAVGNNGEISGQISQDNTTAYPFSPDITKNIPTNLTPGTPAVSYNIAPVESKFRFPQVFRTNFAVDQRLFWGIVGTGEIMFTQNLSYYHYYNANFKTSTSNFDGPDNRPRFAGSAAAERINPKITDATVLSSRPYGQSFMLTFKLEKPVQKGLSWLIAYNYGRTRDYESASTIASSSWTGMRSVRGNNDLDMAYSDNDLRHRIIGNINYRIEFAKTAALQFSLFAQNQNQGRFSYTYSGDMNGDGVSGNDLIYVPRDRSEMNFEQFTTTLNGTPTTFTVQQQQDAFENYINQDAYLKKHRGQYVERNGANMPNLARFDFSSMLELFREIGKTRHTIQFRIDIFNVGNMINPKWGVTDIVNTSSPLVARPAVNNIPVYRMNIFSNSINYGTYRKGTSIADVWQAQLGVRYIF